MALEIKSIKGTQDVLPSQSYKWQFVERLFLDTARLYGDVYKRQVQAATAGFSRKHRDFLKKDCVIPGKRL